MAIKVTPTDVLEDGEKFPIKRIKQAANIAALEALAGMDDEEVRLIPSVGTYRFDASSTATANGTDVVQPASGTGRWVWTDPVGQKIGWVDSQDHATLAAMVTDISTSEKFLRLRPGTHSVATNLTVPSTSGLIADPGTRLKPESGVVVTLNGPIQAGAWQVFDLTAGGSIVLSADAAANAYAQWFGAKGDNATDDTAAIQAGIDAMTSGGTMTFPSGTYRVSRTAGTNDVWGLKITNSNVTLAGAGGLGGSTIRRLDTDISTQARAYPLIFVGTPDSNVAAATENVTIQGIHFRGEDTRHAITGSSLHDFRTGLEVKNTRGLTVSGCSFSYVDSSAIYFQRPADFDQNNSVYYNTTKNYETKITGCTIDAVVHAVTDRSLIHAIHLPGVDDLIVSGCTFSWCDNCFSGDGTYETLANDEDDTYTDTNMGVSVRRSGRGLVISGNIIHSSSEHPIYCGIMDASITGNVINLKGAPITTQDAIKIRGKNVTVSGNVISNYPSGVTVNEPAFMVTVSNNNIYAPGDVTVGAISIDTAGLTTYIDNKEWLTAYLPMTDVNITGNTIVMQEAAHTNLKGAAFRIATDISDANFPEGQVQNISISDNTVRNHRYGLSITASLIQQIAMDNNRFYAKPFTEAGFGAGTTMETKALVLIDGGLALSIMIQMQLRGNTVYGSDHLFMTDDDAATNAEIPRGIYNNGFLYIKTFAMDDFKAPAATNAFHNNWGNRFLDRSPLSGETFGNRLGDGSNSANSLSEQNLLLSGTAVRYYHDGSGGYYELGGDPMGTRMRTRLTTEQQRLEYDVSNYFGTTVDSGGAVSFVASGGSFAFNKLINVTRTTEQLRLRYDGSNYVSFTVDASGHLTMAPTGSLIITAGSNLVQVNSILTADTLRASNGHVSFTGAVTNITIDRGIVTNVS